MRYYNTSASRHWHALTNACALTAHAGITKGTDSANVRRCLENTPPIVSFSGADTRIAPQPRAVIKNS
jgi:hypothetical protein